MTTTKEKGDKLEIEFSKFMKKKLGYKSTDRKRFGKKNFSSQSGSQIDIHGEKINPRMNKKILLSEQKLKKEKGKVRTYIFLFLFFIVFDIFISTSISDFLDEVLVSFGFSNVLGFGGLLLVSILLWNAYSAQRRQESELKDIKIQSKKLSEYTWVECKNHKATVKESVIVKLWDSVNSHNKTIKSIKEAHLKKRDVIYKKMIVVSASGFSADARLKAKEKKITCYERINENTFKKVRL